jgi:hypothetical protein
VTCKIPYYLVVRVVAEFVVVHLVVEVVAELVVVHLVVHLVVVDSVRRQGGKAVKMVVVVVAVAAH